MDIHNFQLGRIFQQNAKEYYTRPVKAMKYQSGAENGWMVYFSNTTNGESDIMIHEGMKFFPTEVAAWEYIHNNKEQYVMEAGERIGMEVEYDSPVPVLYTKDFDPNNKGGLLNWIRSDGAFVSNETDEYEFEVLEDGSWIVVDMDGTIRVWYPGLEETFFGKDNEIVYEKTRNGDYIRVAV